MLSDVARMFMAKMRTRAVAQAALLLLAPPAVFAIGAPDARAQTNPKVPILALDWSAPPECPDGAHVEVRVEHLVGRSDGDKTLTAHGRMTASSTAPRYRLVLHIGGEQSASAHRTMAGDDCARLAEAAALVLALDIDPDALTHAHVEPPSERVGAVDAAPNTPKPQPAEAVLPTRRPAPQPPIEIGLGARLVFDQGSLPRATLGLGAVAEIARGDLSFDFGATVYQPQYVGGPREGAGGAYVELATLGARGCGRRRLATLGVRGCVGAELGREGTRGVGIAEPGASAAPWGAGFLSLEARPWPARWFAPTAGVSLGHPFTAPDVVIGGFGTLFEPPVVFFRAHVGLEMRLF